MQGIIEILEEEHEEILKFIEELKRKCLRFMEEDEVDLNDFREAIAFIRTFADQTHHQKEEQILFKAMTEHLGRIGENLIRHGMLVEHDLARLYVSELENAVNAYEKDPSGENKLDILANAMGYYYLLKRHALKENEVVYPYAVKNLPPELMAQLDEAARDYQKKYQ